MNFVWVMVIILILAQIEGVCVSKYLLNTEEKYCSSCDWWVDGCTKLPFVMTFIPFVGLFCSIALGIDCVRNIVRAFA